MAEKAANLVGVMIMVDVEFSLASVAWFIGAANCAAPVLRSQHLLVSSWWKSVFLFYAVCVYAVWMTLSVSSATGALLVWVFFAVPHYLRKVFFRVIFTPRGYRCVVTFFTLITVSLWFVLPFREVGQWFFLLAGVAGSHGQSRSLKLAYL